MLKSKNIFVSVSGGETSWFMAYLIKKYYLDKNLLFAFANTSKEREETYTFNIKCSSYFDIDLTWVEAQVHHNQRKGNTHSIVTPQTAKRDGSIFEETIKKYGIPNKSFPHCTRELKSNPLKSLADSHFGKAKYSKAIGIRLDEIDRVSKEHKKYNLIYPLISDFLITKEDVNAFWERMPFRLELKSYEGNCDYCFKKSDRKLFTLRSEEEEGHRLSWWANMEHTYGNFVPKTRSHSNPPYTFFRLNKSSKDIERLALEGGFKKAEDDRYRVDFTYIDQELDISNGCEESCEPIF